MNLQPIGQRDWDVYEWTEVSELGRPERIFLRGKRRVPPPQDGYHYERSDSPLDKEYHWERVYEVVSV